MTNVGLGFRRDLANEIIEGELTPDFIEIAPENWIDLGGFWKQKLDKASEKYKITSHGLSLSIGSEEPLDTVFIKKIRSFLDTYNIDIYSEHLSYTKSANAHLYDLLPIPFRQDAVDHVVDRIRTVQDLLGRRIAIENVSYYTPVAPQMTEIEFINQIVEQSDCNLLLDVNNVYVNAFNHGYNSKKFIQNLPLDKVAYIHMAGHEQISDDLIIDTHGQPIITPVFELFEWVIEQIKPVPVLLERDFNFDDLKGIKTELKQLRNICNKYHPSPHEVV